MKHDVSRWKKLDEAEMQRKKGIDELHDDGYRLFCQCHYEQAAMLFAQAAILAKQEGNLSGQCENLYWEGKCYLLNNQLKKALAYFLKAEQLEGLDAVNQFYNLNDLFNVAIYLNLPQAKIQSILDRLRPYKDVQQIGGSKSMVLNAESTFLSLCGKDAEALAKAQEAFDSQIYSAPRYNDSIYFSELIAAYRFNNQIAEAWDTLRRWRKEGSYTFADTKYKQLMEELRLYYYENKLDDAWDVLQRVKAEEQYLGMVGRHVVTLNFEILIGTKTDRLEQIKPALNIIFKKYRNSEDFGDRYSCYKAFARYCCASCRVASQGNREKMAKHTRFWLIKAEKMAKYLDELMHVSWRNEQVQKIRKNFKEIDYLLESESS